MRRVASLLFAGTMVVGCGGIGIPQISIPPIVLPSLPPIVLPSGVSIPTLAPGTTACALVTAAEVTSIFGSAATETSASGECTFTFSNFSTISVSTESGSDLQSSRFLFGNTAKDITVAGLPALSGVFIGQPAVHVQRGGDQLQVLGILTGSDDATIAKLVQIATIAVSRWP